MCEQCQLVKRMLASVLAGNEVTLFPQVPQQKTTLTVEGYPGRAPVIQLNGKSYVEIESLGTPHKWFRQL